MKYFLILVILAALSLFLLRPASVGLANPLSSGITQSFVRPSPAPTSIPVAAIGLVGDLGLGRNITATARSENDFSWSFQGISSWLQSNDFTLANLESPIIADCPTGKTGTFTFCGDPKFLPYLKQNKFIFNLANNHIFNYGQSGFDQTAAYLTQNNILHVYSLFPQTEFATATVNGITFGFLGFDLVTNPKLDPKIITDLVKKYKPRVDWLVVSIHWGTEYLPAPEPWRVNLAHQLIDAGADIIHGQHPHVWQGEETYHGKKIYYSFGNFIFDQDWSSATSHSNIVRLTLTKDKIIKEEVFPIVIKFNSQPWLVSPILPSPSPLP